MGMGQPPEPWMLFMQQQQMQQMMQQVMQQMSMYAARQDQHHLLHSNLMHHEIQAIHTLGNRTCSPSTSKGLSEFK
jgi:hypothetical protein